MAISHSLVFQEASGTNASSYTTTGTLTATAGKLYYGVSGWRGTALRSLTSVVHNASSNPVTFVQSNTKTYNTVATPLSRIVSYRGMNASADSNAGTLTLTLSGSVSCCHFIISEFSGVDTSGTNGSGAVLQETVGNNGDSVNTLNVVLSALSNSNNRPWSAASTNKVCTFTPDSNYTEIGDVSAGGSEVFAINSQWGSTGTGDLTCTHTPSTTANNMGGISVELVAASAGNPVGDADGLPDMWTQDDQRAVLLHG